jgi:hypothetical protein
VILNVLLIPSLEDTGSAIAMLATEIVFVTVAMVVSSRTVGGIDWRPMLAAPLAAGAVMVPVTLLLADLFVVAVLAGLIVYIAAFVLVERAVSPADLRFVGDLLKRRLASRAPA